MTSRATTAARAGAVFAVTLVVLQILQQVVGAFDPRVLWHPGRLLANVISGRWPAVSKSRPCLP